MRSFNEYGSWTRQDYTSPLPPPTAASLQVNGVWVPAVTPSTSGTVTLDPALSWGSYMVMGTMVWMQCTLAVSAVAAPVGQINVDGFPAAFAPVQHADPGVCTTYPSGTWPITATGVLIARALFAPAGRIRVQMWQGGAAVAAAALLQAGEFLQISGWWSLVP